MTLGVTIAIVLTVALLGFVVTKFGWAIKTQPPGTRWRGRVRGRRPSR